MNKIQGIYAAALSVFNDDLSLNVDLTVKHANFLIKNGLVTNTNNKNCIYFLGRLPCTTENLKKYNLLN